MRFKPRPLQDPVAADVSPLHSSSEQSGLTSAATVLKEAQPFALLTLLVVCLVTSGCGSFIAHRMVQAPNTYPKWLAPVARVELAFGPALLTNFPAYSVKVGPPSARLHYRLFEPADYAFSVSSTNWLRRGKKHFRFGFRATLPGKTNTWTASPRGTVVLLHGYGLSEFAMAPWALAPVSGRLALCAGGPAWPRQIHRPTHLLRACTKHTISANSSIRSQPTTNSHRPWPRLGNPTVQRWRCDGRRRTRASPVPWPSRPTPASPNAVINLCREYSPWFPFVPPPRRAETTAQGAGGGAGGTGNDNGARATTGCGALCGWCGGSGHASCGRARFVQAGA